MMGVSSHSVCTDACGRKGALEYDRDGFHSSNLGSFHPLHKDGNGQVEARATLAIMMTLPQLFEAQLQGISPLD